MPPQHRGRSTILFLLALLLIVAAASLAAQRPTPEKVTDAMLQNPDPADWINWRRTLNGWGYSPLSQINRTNADQLQMVWSRVVTPGVGEATPLVYKGLMFIAKPMFESNVGGVLALDAATGDVIWEYRKALQVKPAFDGRMRSLAIYGDKIFLSTPDAHIVALEAATGRVAWDHTVADHNLGYRYTSGPIVVRGRIVAGMTGCDKYKNDVCFVSAHDPETGKELWRTATIARPGEPGGDTWGNLPLNFRAGGDAWIPGSYDPVTDLIYWSVAQAKPWARVSRGTDGAALYTNSVLALNPDTGKVVWFHQLLPGETHDMDEVFENILIDRPNRRSLFKMGKLGILWELDRVKGTFVAAHDLGYQTILTVDRATGAVAYKPGMIPQDGVPLEFCPGLGGLRTWRSMAFHPETQALYIPISLNCQRSIFRKVEQVDGGAGSSVRPFAGEETVATLPHPASPDARGQFIAMSIDDGRILWRDSARRGFSTAALTTGGGLAIVGDGDGNMNVYDVADGVRRFQTGLTFVGSGFPVTYMAQGRQYIAFPATTTGPGVAVFALAEAKR